MVYEKRKKQQKTASAGGYRAGVGNRNGKSHGGGNSGDGSGYAGGSSGVAGNNTGACAPGDAPGASPFGDAAFFEELVAQRILSCVQALGDKFGRNKMVGVLIGVASNYVIESAEEARPHYGTLARFSRREVLAMVDQLIGRGLIRLNGVDYPCLRLTPEGMEALRDGCGARVRLPIRLEPMAVPVPADAGLYALMREFRNSAAKEEDLPAYCVFNNSILLDVVRHKPQTLEQLAQVKGFADKRLEKYGAAIVQLVKDYADGNIPAEDIPKGSGNAGGIKVRGGKSPSGEMDEAYTGQGAGAPPAYPLAGGGEGSGHAGSRSGPGLSRDFRTAAQIARENGLG
jgi:hypothetical protein